MLTSKQRCLVLLTGALTCSLTLQAQEPPAGNSHNASPAATENISPAAIAGAKQDPVAVARGGKAFATYCAGCHGVSAKGGPGAPDLVRSLLVLDDEKGILIAPVIREGRPDKGMPKLAVSEPQIADIVAWLHVRTYAAGHRATYSFRDVVTGDAAQGKAYFDGAGRCSSCHSASGDLAGVARKYDPYSLQQRWLQPRNARRGNGGPGGSGAPASSASMPTVTVTSANGQIMSGTLKDIDDFTVTLLSTDGQIHTVSREGDGAPKVVVHDPLQAHNQMLRRYTDADIHNVTAYLVTLK